MKRTKKNVVLWCGILAAGLVFSCLAGISMASDMLKWTGCGITRKAFMTELAQGYKDESGAIVSLSGGGATKGIRDTDAGRSDMGGNCRPSLPGKFPDQESNVEMYVVAWDALVPIVNKRNPVESVTSRQLKDVLTGKITNWKELGGPDQQILVVARQGKVSGVGYMTRIMIFEDETVDYTDKALIVKSSGPLENKVYVDEISIGVTGISSAKKRISSGKEIKILKVNGVEPSVSNISAGIYPFYRPLYLSVNRNLSSYPAVKKFMDWVLSDQGQKIIASVGTVNLQMGKGLKDKFKYWENTEKIVNFDSLQ